MRIHWTCLGAMLVLAGGLAVAVNGVAQDAGHLDRQISAAGNAATDGGRLATLEALRAWGGLSAQQAMELDRLIEEIRRWIEDPNLAYFNRPVLNTQAYDFGVAPDSPFQPLATLYRARMLFWVTLEHGGLWSDPAKKRAQFDLIRPLFEEAHTAFPENPIVRMYLGEPLPPERHYPLAPSAPEWAVYQREGLERLADIIEWWIAHRQQDDGAYGGGWGDDCEMWRWWAPVLIGFEAPGIIEAQARFSRALLEQPHMRGGYTDRVYDVEHTSEDSSDVLTPMMHLEPDNPEWRGAALRIVELFETLWGGVNARGQLQFKSTYFSVDEVDLDPARACDTVYHVRALQPALLYWQRTGDPQLTDLFTRWLDTWVDAAARADRGKPAGIVPSAIHWPDGGIGGVGENWWDPENHDNDPLYVWPSAMGLMTNALLLGHHVTGEARYLDPLKAMAAARLDHLENPDPTAAAGTRAWCGARLGVMESTAATYRLVSGGRDFDALLARAAPPYVRFRLDGDIAPLTDALRQNAEALRINFPGYTSEVRYTDRVLRFPSVFSANGMYPDAVAGIAPPDPMVLYATATGDPGHPQVFPTNAVRWLTPPRDVAALVRDVGPKRFEAELFHFGRSPRAMGAELYLLEPGLFRARLVNAEGTVLRESVIEVAGSRARLGFELPAQTPCTLEVAPAP